MESISKTGTHIFRGIVTPTSQPLGTIRLRSTRMVYTNAGYELYPPGFTRDF
jgi:hypothetical protein